jgi:THO complex subunit 4
MSTIRSYHFGYVVCSAPQRGGWRGNGRPANSSQSSGGRGQGKGRGQDQNHAPMSAADLDAELDKYHSQAMKEN